MKKNKLVGLSALLLSIGMVGCGEVEPCAEHDWGDYVETLAATCTAAGSKERTCKVCNEKETKETAKKSHTWTTVSETNSTCTVQGVKKEKCSVCGEEKETKKSLAAHTYGDTVWTQEANCTEGGIGKKTCTACGHEEDVTVDPNGHTETKDEEKSVAPTCLAAGNDVMHCSVCGNDRDVEVAQLGHNYQLVGDKGVRDGDKAAVNVYKCENGCEDTTFGFNADEVTAASKERLHIDEETGAARFFGHPIGNDVTLNENGDAADGENAVAVFNKEQTGDYFEYIFDLTQQQVDALGGKALCWCDAQPANYLGNYDFWRVGSETDWTKAFYIDGEHEGEEINDYRYVLYVDNVRVDFDDTMNSPVKADPSEPSCGGSGKCLREEFAIPYVFNLKVGTNKLSLRMAGGYRSEFYKFTFRPYEEKEVPPTVELNSLGSFKAVEYASATEGVVAGKSGETTGIKFSTVYNVGTAGTGSNGWKQTAPVAAEDASVGDNVVYTVKADKAVNGAKLIMTINYPANSWDSANLAALSAIDGDATKGYIWDEATSTWNASPVRYKLFVNDAEVVIDPTMEGYTEPVMGNQKKDVAVELPCSINLKEGNNKIELQSYGGYGPVIAGFEIKANSDAVVTNMHAHKFVEGKCSCGLEAIDYELKDQTNTAKAYANGDKLDKSASAAANAAKFSITLDKDFEGYIYAKGGVDNKPNWTYGWHIGKNGGNSAVTLPDGKTNTILKLGEEQLTIVDGTYEELSGGAVAGVKDNATLANVGYIKMAAVSLTAGQTYEITLQGVDSFAPNFWGIALVGTFTEVAPAPVE